MQVGSGWQSCETQFMSIDKDDADALRNAVKLLEHPSLAARPGAVIDISPNVQLRV